VRRKLGEKDRDVLTRVARFVNRMTEDELPLYIYTVYGYREESNVIENSSRGVESSRQACL